MNERKKQFGEKISFIFNDSKYLKDFKFKNDKKLNEKDISEEFKKKDEEFKERREKSKKKGEEF